jgi:uncharacterized protein (TIGR03086 family)
MGTTEVSVRYRRIAARFTRVAEAVPASAWDDPAPCDGWVARDVVGHLVEWVPAFFPADAGIGVAAGTSVDDDPMAAWRALDEALQTALDDPEVAAREVETQAGRHTVEAAIANFVMGDVLVHTWDLARASGLDETLDADEVHRLYEGMLPIDEVLRQSGQYGPRVDVAEDADEQTKLIAFTGRRP